jgi:hypothetical protein
MAQDHLGTTQLAGRLVHVQQNVVGLANELWRRAG